MAAISPPRWPPRGRQPVVGPGASGLAHSPGRDGSRPVTRRTTLCQSSRAEGSGAGGSQTAHSDECAQIDRTGCAAGSGRGIPPPRESSLGSDFPVCNPEGDLISFQVDEPSVGQGDLACHGRGCISGPPGAEKRKTQPSERAFRPEGRVSRSRVGRSNPRVKRSAPRGGSLDPWVERAAPKVKPLHRGSGHPPRGSNDPPRGADHLTHGANELPQRSSLSIAGQVIRPAGRIA
jgi:hypothetical protein